MSRRKIPSNKALADALRLHDGNMSTVAKHFKCHRSLVWQYVNRDSALRDLVDELSEAFIDEAESVLYNAIRDGNVVATIFFLKTKARHRGYSERLELIPLDRQEIEVELGHPIKNDHVETLNGHETAVALLEQ